MNNSETVCNGVSTKPFAVYSGYRVTAVASCPEEYKETHKLGIRDYYLFDYRNSA